jgi:hypothetical protein
MRAHQRAGANSGKVRAIRFVICLSAIRGIRGLKQAVVDTIGFGIFRSWKASYPSNRLAAGALFSQADENDPDKQTGSASKRGVAACCGIPSAKLRFACRAQ